MARLKLHQCFIPRMEIQPQAFLVLEKMIGSGEEEFKYLYHTWAWQLSYLMDHDHLYKFSIPLLYKFSISL